MDPARLTGSRERQGPLIDPGLERCRHLLHESGRTGIVLKAKPGVVLQGDEQWLLRQKAMAGYDFRLRRRHEFLADADETRTAPTVEQKARLHVSSIKGVESGRGTGTIRCVRGMKGAQSGCGTWTVIREGAFGTTADAPGGYSFNWRVCRTGVLNLSQGKTGP
jgi:hypothetical protein